MDVVANAKAAVRRAIELDPADPIGHLMLSNLFFSIGDFAGFRKAGDAALDLNPNNSVLLAHYGMRLAFRGDWDRGLALVTKALTLNPVHPHWYRLPEAVYRYDRGEYESALAELEKIDMPKFLWTHLLRVAIFGQLDRLEEARIATEKLLKLKPTFRQEAPNLIRIWQFSEPLYQSILEGLGKAGLDIAMEASVQSN